MLFDALTDGLGIPPLLPQIKRAREDYCTNPKCTDLNCMFCFVLLDALTDDLGLPRIKRARTHRHNDNAISRSDGNHVCELGTNTEASTADLGLTQEQVDGDKVRQASACEIHLSHASHAEPQSFQPSTRSARTRSQSVQDDRGPSGHLNHLDDTDL